ncbi:hypothetical protein [Leptospira perdikensis]|uniref:Uncharacterized protein n=1 Tax=Leptospira perdikensis TaxID=2484948 RepID=A0A4R9JI20_9LEPT|nr:hypothetical protein [Leptospira perdikensis]TGL44547.1 hypothetical protein EHQ49_03485 [Leptospira perdikensis]
MKQLSKLIFVFLIFPTAFLMNCSKKKVENFPAPKSIFFVGDTVGIQYYLTEEPDSEKGEVLLVSDNVKVVGSIQIEKGQSNYKTYQIQCPERIKAKCKSEFVYVRADDIADESILSANYYTTSQLNKYILLTPDGYNNAILTQKIIKEPKKITETINLNNFNLFNFLLQTSGMNSDDKTLKVEEIYLLSKYTGDPALDDSYIKAILKKYPFTKDRLESGKFSAFSASEEFISSITEQRNFILNSFIAGFPLRSPSFKGLVGQFNKLKSFPYMTEKLFEYFSKEGLYVTSGSEYQYLVNANSGIDALTKLKKVEPTLDPSKTIGLVSLQNQSETNYQIKIETLDISGNVLKEDIQSILSITAEESGNSMGFKIKTDKSELILSPLETTPNLLIAGQGFREFLKTIPNDHKEIIKNNDYKKAIMLIALKFGEGGFDDQLGKMQYRLSAQNRYWIMLDIFRFNPIVKRTTDYSGTLDTSFSENDLCYNITKWRQPKGELYVTGVESSCYSDSDESPEPTESMCFSEGSSGFFQIEFLPSDLRSDKPNVNFLYNDTGVCQVIHHIMQ